MQGLVVALILLGACSGRGPQPVGPIHTGPVTFAPTQGATARLGIGAAKDAGQNNLVF
jgi:hypothetical protein